MIKSINSGRVEREKILMLNITGGGEKRFRSENKLFYLKPEAIISSQSDTKDIRPKFFGLFTKDSGYNKKKFTSDLIAGVIVGIIALPLAIAFGIASGVTPQQGLITAIVAGLLTSIFGGSNFLIGGPTGAFIVIVFGIVSKYGMSGVFWPKITTKVPGSLIAIILGTIGSIFLSRYMGIEFATIGSKFPELAGGIPLPRPVTPNIDFEAIKLLFQPAITIALLCAIESLLSAMVADGVTGKKHDSNTELIGQGIANIVTPFFGGIPATGAIARTMANINNGGKTPVAGIIHAIVLIIIFLFLMPYAVYIPLSCLAAILIIVAYNMSEWRSFKYLLKGHKADVAVLLLTFFLTVIVDLTVAIEVGVVLAIILFVKRVSETSTITVLNQPFLSGTENDENTSDIEILDIPKGVEVYEIDGPFFFGLANKLDELDVTSHHILKVRVIRMRKVPFMDSTGLNNLRNLWKRSRREKIRIILSGVSENVLETLSKSGFADEIGRDNIFPHIQLALAKASEIVKEQEFLPKKHNNE